MAWIGHVEEEDLILPPHNAEEAAEGQRPPIAGEADMMRLMAHGAGSRQWDGPEDVAVGWRVGSKVDDGHEVGGLMRWVPRPDEQGML
jgi:hypothetical protein